MKTVKKSKEKEIIKQEKKRKKDIKKEGRNK